MSQQTLPASARVKARLAERQGRVTAPAETASPATKEDLEALRSELEILIDQHDELAQAKRFLKRWLGWSLKIPLPVRWFGALLGAVTVVVATFTLEENIEPYTIRLTGQFNDMSGSGQANADRCILSGGGQTSYTPLSNHYASALADSNYLGYGFCAPSGSLRTAFELVDRPGAFGLIQEDVLVRLQAQDAQFNALTVLQDTGQIEALIPLSAQQIDWSQIKARADAGESIKVGLPSVMSGSYHTAMALFDAMGVSEQLDIHTYTNQERMIADAQEGELDVILSVERPGRTYGQWLGLYEPLMRDRLQPVSIPGSMIDQLQGHPALSGMQVQNISLRPSWWDRVLGGTEEEITALTTRTFFIARDSSLEESDRPYSDIELRHAIIRNGELPEIASTHVQIAPPR